MELVVDTCALLAFVRGDRMRAGDRHPHRDRPRGQARLRAGGRGVGDRAEMLARPIRARIVFDRASVVRADHAALSVARESRSRPEWRSPLTSCPSRFIGIRPTD